ncbi:helix-turn-helix domain-containing protein [Saccharopolyspora sp. K220]|uniref:helix-turn-helix domain-containing protein n=1 Tax=Saccharopolyspora soli TaxID=2926618 RepID=UPI001F572E9B|nr:helix-turn-helix transcriptional regulator [Saccharopolyspora soli]MCI2417421.1 helix-turn-helix domain-containing protein [Saccharopolyspora soli]
MARSGSQNGPNQLAARLRELRRGRGLTQGVLARALGVGVSSISSWESGAKTPPPTRLADYATFFATERSAVSTPPRLVPADSLTEEERTERGRLKRELDRMHATARPAAASWSGTRTGFWYFPDGGPVRIVCGKLPDADRPPFASASNHNYMELAAYADLDSMVELFGHVRALNPTADVRHALAPRLESDDLQAHLVLLGSSAMNQSTSPITKPIDFPVEQIKDPAEVQNGEVFEIPGDQPRRFVPRFTDDEQLIEDVGLLVRMPNPNNISRTLTICSGVFTRGVYGAVRCLTDATTRERNYEYLTGKFGDATNFGLLMRVRVSDHATATPDLHNPRIRLHEWHRIQ